MTYKAVPSISNLQAFISLDTATSTEITLAENKNQEQNTVTLKDTVFCKVGNLLLFDSVCFISQSLGFINSIEVQSIDNPHSLATDAKGTLVPTKELKGYTKISLKVGKQLKSVRDFSNTSLVPKNRKVLTPITVSFLGIYNQEDHTFDDLIIPACESDTYLKLFVLYPFGKLRYLRGTVYDYQEIAELKDGSMKAQWVFEGHELSTYLVNQ